LRFLSIDTCLTPSRFTLIILPVVEAALAIHLGHPVEVVVDLEEVEGLVEVDQGLDRFGPGKDARASVFYSRCVNKRL